MSRRGRLTILFTVAIALVFGLSLAAGWYFFDLALDRNVNKSVIFSSSHNQHEIPEAFQLSATPPPWLDNTAWSWWERESHDGLKLVAREIPSASPSGKWIILCHGYLGDNRQMLAVAQICHDMGYNALLPDSRGAGRSEGDYIGMGWPDRLDVQGWISQILERDPGAEIVLYGVSMGGATVMMTAGEALPHNVKAVISDCGYSSVWAEFSYQLQQLYGLSDFPVLHMTSLVCRLRTGFWLGDASALDQVAKAEVPILFIHGGNDTLAPTVMAHQLYEACASDKELLIVPNAGHGVAGIVDAELYWATIRSFLDKYVGSSN